MTATRIPRICMVGSCMVDLVSRVPRLPSPGETLIGSSFSIGFGGKGANQAVMAARLGAAVSVVVKLGRDVFGENTLKNFKDQGIDTQQVLFDDTRFSGVAPIAVDERTGQNSIIIVPGANEGLSPADVQAGRGAIGAADVVICQLEIPMEATMEAFRIARAASRPGGGRAITILNPAPAAPLPDEMLHLVDVCVPNETETQLITGMRIGGIDDAVAAGKNLRRRGPKTVVLTLGERGALIIDENGDAQHVPAQKVKAVDSTGAGDAFVGSLAYFLGRGTPLRAAVERSCAIATRSVVKHGTQTSFPTREEVQSLLS